jgi:hypothetical protein
LDEVVINKAKLITGGMYLPEKMHEIITEIKTLNLRFVKLGLTKDVVIDSAFYAQFKLLYNDLLFNI